MRPTLFDFNGVLVDDEDVHFEAFREAVAPLGIELTRAAYVERYLGYDDAGAFRAILEDARRAASDEAIAALVEEKKPLYLKRVDRVHVFDGAAELIARRAARGPVAIVSGALRHEIELGLEKLGAKVDFIVAAEDAPRCKPDPMGYLLAVQRLGEDGARAVVIEDSVAGVRAAKRARLRCVAVTHTYRAEELAEADAITTSLAAITDDLLESDR